MAQPTLAYGTATITLPYPKGSASNVRSYQQLAGTRRTIGGLLRRWVAATWYTYHLEFEHQDRSVYDQITALVATADAAQSFPTFTWADGQWASTGTAVQVAVAISDLAPASPLYAWASWTLDLAEVNPR